MNLLVILQRPLSPLSREVGWGQRKLRFLQGHAPEDWQIHAHYLPPALPVVIDDPSEFVPEDLPEAELLIALSENAGVGELIPDFAQACGAQAVIAPVDNRAWLPLGLQKQVERRLEAMGIAVVFPAPFCTLREEDSDDPRIVAFARRFGRPEVKIVCEEGRVQQVEVCRVAPCGNTAYVAEKLVGVSARDAVTRAGLLHHHYPCWASMDMDDTIGDTLMHQGGLMIKLAVEKALKES